MSDVNQQAEHSEALAMTRQQRALSAGGASALKKYKDLVVGSEKGWGFFCGFELYNLLVANMPSILGFGLRRALLPFFLKEIGRGCAIGKSVTIRQPSRIRIGSGVLIDDYAALDVRADSADESGIEIGNNVLIGRQTLIIAKNAQIKLGDACNISSDCRIATQSKIEIGKSVLVAAYAYIGPGNHRFADGEAGETGKNSVPLIEQEMDIRGGVKIGDHAWIGARVTILDGITIGREAIIGAHSLVREDVSDRSIVAGSPAKVLKDRS